MATRMIQRRNVLVVGKTGAGKSTVCNQISGHDNFVVKSSSQSVTTQVSHTEVQGFDPERNVEFMFKIIDTIGFFDTNSSNTAVLMEIRKYFQEKCPDGVNLVLFVFKRGRFTKEERETFEFLQANFQQQISSACALVITNCDGVDDDGREKTIDEFRSNPDTWATAEFMKKGIYTVGFPDIKTMMPALKNVYEDMMKVDARKLRKLVMDSGENFLSREILQQSFWDNLQRCTIL